jgi:hypothetical protein
MADCKYIPSKDQVKIEEIRKIEDISSFIETIRFLVREYHKNKKIKNEK